MADEQIPRRPHPLLVALAAVGVLTLTAVLFLVGGVGLIIYKVGQSNLPFGIHKSANLRGTLPGKHIAGIKMHEAISAENSALFLEKLEEAAQDADALGILIDVNSPGGSVVASQEIYDAIALTKQKKPIVAYVHDMAASGAYYGIAPANAIIANRGSFIGSVGVILSGMETSQLLNWLKVRPVTLTTGKFKDAGSPTREWTDEDRKYLQKLLDDTREQFVSDLRKARNLDESTLTFLSDGRVVLGTEALKLKLVDRLGSRNEALKLIAEQAGKTEGELPELFFIEEPIDLMEKVSKALEGRSMIEHLRSEIDGMTTETLHRK